MFSAATVPFAVSADSNVTVQYLFASGFFPSGFVGSFGPTTFSNTVKAFVCAVRFPFVKVTFFSLFANVNDVSFVGSVVIPLSAKFLNATSFVKP